MNRALHYKTANGEKASLVMNETNQGFHIVLRLYCEQMNEMVVSDCKLVDELEVARSIYHSFQMQAISYVNKFDTEWFID